MPRHSLLAAYLEFLFGLLTGVKWMCTLTRSGLSESVTESLEIWINQAVELIQGGLFVTVSCVLVTVATAVKPDQWLLPTSTSVLTNRDHWFLLLAEHSFVLLADLLTTHTSEPEMRQACTILNTSLTSQSDSTHQTLSTAHTPHVIAALQAMALRLLLDSPRALQGLLAFSSVPLHSLLSQFKALDQGLSVGIPSTTTVGLLPRLNRTHPLATVVWFGLTLVHRVLSLEHAMFEQREQTALSTAPSPPRASLLSSLTAYVDAATREHYVAVLFTYLRYPYHMGLSRSAVTLVKWLTQHTAINIMDYLSPDSITVIRDCVLDRLASTSPSATMPVDPLTRIALFDLIAETTAHESTIPDQLSLLLLNSVTKLIAALYLQEATTYVTILKSKPNFWNLLTEPMFLLLSADVKTQREFTQVEHEYCGHVASILGLELFCSQSLSGLIKPDDPVQSVVNRLSRDNAYTSWFRLVANTGEYLQSSGDHDSDSALSDCHGPILASLYEATCRWKCLLMVHVDWIRQLETRGTDASGTNTVVVVPLQTETLIDQLIRGLHQLKPFLEIQSASDLTNQLAVCLSITVNQFLSTTAAKPGADQKNLTQQLTQLVDFLITVRPGLDEQARHLHADLLACATMLWHKLHGSSHPPDSNTGTCQSNDTLGQLRIDLTDCAFGYVAQLAIYPNLSLADEAAFRQAISLMLKLWDTTSQSSDLCTRLVQAGVFNNLLVTLEQQSQSRTGAALGHDILILVMRVLLADTCSSGPSGRVSLIEPADTEIVVEMTVGPSECTTVRSETSDAEKSFGFELILSGAQTVGSYRDLLVRAFTWPATDTLLQWIHEDEMAVSVCVCMLGGICLHSHCYLPWLTAKYIWDTIGCAGHQCTVAIQLNFVKKLISTVLQKETLILTCMSILLTLVICFSQVDNLMQTTDLCLRNR
ncbi:unnamed protein product [Echinostoma caproni]|uniref:DUF2428 domain-containing protein n=1 Tax=Echinostoma caproni TaxID=27848 RepID=A0A183ARJ1_9TREM|nr:unnamed protein product [Echinostoma caproni]